MKNILLSSASRQLKLIRNGTIKPSELLNLYFNQIEKLNDKINAIIWMDKESAYREAKILDEDTVKQNWRGPLHGLPVTVKESFDIKGAPSTWGNPKLKNHKAKADSDVVKRLKKAGAIVFGKSNVPLQLAEWQTFNKVYGTTNNPWDLTRTPGGSSGGSAAALASGMTALEVGSDIGSSIRNPAHYCGVFGLKPTYNVVSTKGHGAEDWHVSTDISVAGPLSRSAADLKIAFDVIKGPSNFFSDAWSLNLREDKRKKLKDFKVGVLLDHEESPIEKSYKNILINFVEKINACGAEVKYNEIPKIDNSLHFTIYLKLLGAALSGRTPKETYEEQLEDIKSLNNKKIMRVSGNRTKGLGILHRDQLNLINQRLKHRLVFDDYFKEIDVLITPVASSSAFKHNQNGPRHRRFLNINGISQPENLQLFWSGYSGVVGLPSVVGPAGFDNSLPVGYQAISGFGRDYTALAFAIAVEKEIFRFNCPKISIS